MGRSLNLSSACPSVKCNVSYRIADLYSVCRVPDRTAKFTFSLKPSGKCSVKKIVFRYCASLYSAKYFKYLILLGLNYRAIFKL